MGPTRRRDDESECVDPWRLCSECRLCECSRLLDRVGDATVVMPSGKATGTPAGINPSGTSPVGPEPLVVSNKTGDAVGVTDTGTNPTGRPELETTEFRTYA